MDNNSYAQLIDDFEKGLLVIEGESLTDYISRMGGVDYDAKANGGIMGYAVGGRTQNLDQYGLQYGEGLNPYAPDVQIDNMPTNRGYTNFDDQEVGIINTDISNQMADLSKGQMKALSNPITKFNIMDSDTNPQSRDYNTILNDVGFRAQDIKGKPPTKQNIIDYYNGTYKPQARLTNEEYLSRNNNLTANANNIGRDFTFDTPPQQTMFDKAKNFASSGISKGGKLGMDVVNMLKNNNPLGFVSSLANTRNPLSPGSSNYDSNLQDQIDSLKGQTGTRITGTSDNLKFTDGLSMINDNKYGLGSVLAGKNVVSGFGTNNYEVSLQDYIDKMMGYKTRSTFQQAKVDRARQELAAEQGRQQSALEAQLAAAAIESARMGYQDYGQGGVQDGNYDTSNMDSNNNYSDPLSDDTE